MHYAIARQNPRQFRALTSLNVDEFDLLLSIFEEEWTYFIERRNLDGTPRLRKYVPKNEQQLPLVVHKLFFILFYQKTNSLQEVLASYFDLDVSMANKWIHILTPILEKSLKKYAPQGPAATVQIPPGSTCIIDGTERPVQRDTYEQETFYSGKKGTHTVKNLLIINTLGLILWLGATQPGRLHDTTLAADVAFSQPVTVRADLGFLGWKPLRGKVILPHKKPKNTKTEVRTLTQQQKVENTLLARERVLVENVLAHVKIMRIVKDRNRNYKQFFRNSIMRTACSMHNFRTIHRKIAQKEDKIC